MKAIDAAVAAVGAGDLAALEMILAESPGLASSPAPGGASLLLFACYHRNDAMVKLLRATRDRISVHEAAALGECGVMTTLLEADAAAIDGTAPDGFTPLHLAAYFGREACVRVLLAMGANPGPEAANGMRMTPLHSAVAGSHHAVVSLLLEAGADPNVFQHGGWTPLHGAALHGDSEMAEILLAGGAEATHRASDGRSPADMARGAGHETLASRLD